MNGDLYRRPRTPAEQRRFDELAAELAVSREVPPTAARESAVPRPAPSGKTLTPEPATPPVAPKPEEPPEGRRHEPQPEDLLRAPLCLRCWHLRDSLGHFW